MIARVIFRFMSDLTKLVRDEKGQIIILFTIMVPVIMGVIGLSLEVGRYRLLNSQLQNLADASALAGAKELDGASDAIDRATTAAKTYLSNDTWWSNVTLGGVQIQDPPIFYSDLKCVPDCITTPIDVNASDAASATYIKVTTIDRQIAPAFLLAVGAISNQATRATATAGSTYIACNVQPFMMCNPFEPIGKEFQAAVDDGTVKPGMMFHMKVKGDQTPGGSGQSFAPGDFGLLDPPGLNSSGSTLIRNLLSQQNLNFCVTNGVSPRTGQAVQKVSDGLNVRFDMPVNGNTAGLDQVPAPDVIKGLMHSNCGNSPQYTQTGTVPLPEDDPAGTQIIGNMELGNGSLYLANSYWTNHYGGNWPGDLKAAGQANRYLAYRRELGLDGQTAPTPLSGTENRLPVCNTAPSPEKTAKRRIISVAVLNCIKDNVTGNSTTNIISKAYANMFLFRPSWNYTNNNASSGDVWGEFLDLITPQNTTGDGKLHQIVQLYRDH